MKAKVGDLVKIIGNVDRGKHGIVIQAIKSFPAVEVVLDGDNPQWFTIYECEVLNESR